MFYVIFWVLYIWELDIWDLPWCFMIFLRHRRPENFQFCWIRRVLAQCRAQGSVSDGLHQNTVLSEPRVRPEKWRQESSSSRTSSHLQPAEPHFSKMLAASVPGRATRRAVSHHDVASAFFAAGLWVVFPSSAQIWTSFFPGTTNNLRCPDRAGVRGGPGGPGRVQLSRKWEQRGEAKKTILLRRGGPRHAAPPRPPKTLVEDPRGGPPLPRTTKKNVEVGAALHGRPESTSYPLAVQTLKDRAVSWVRPHRAEVTFGPPSLVQNKYLRSNLSFM